MQRIYSELVTGLRAFFQENCFSKAVVALSGGLDSAIVVALAVKALGPENVRVLLLPSEFSSDHSVGDSVEMAKKCGIQCDNISIESLYNETLKSLRPIFEGTQFGLAEENLQSRLRMVLTMAVCNKTGALMLNTSNKSEILVGYGTLWGDTCGAVGVIASLYKSEVYDLANHINQVENSEIIPKRIIEKRPSAELRPGQYDTDSLPDYDVLDAILRLLVDVGESVEKIVAKGYERKDVERVYTLWKNSAFKRKMLPPSLIISEL